MRSLLVLLAITLACAAGPPSGEACVCYQSEGLEADFREADAVFAGHIVALEVVAREARSGTGEYMVATFAVEKRWKGPEADTLRVATCGTQVLICTCGADFELGGRYLVFAASDPALDGGAMLVTGSCDRTQMIGPRIKDHLELEWLGVEDLVKQLESLAALRGREGGGQQDDAPAEGRKGDSQ